MKKENEYIKNTIILSFGKFATQFIAIILLPIFTRYLTTDDFGYIDLIQTYINLFIPVFLLCFDTAVFRFLIDVRGDTNEEKKIISNSILVLIIQTFVIVFLALILSFGLAINYYWWLIVNLITLMFSNIFLQICRGLGKNIYYSVSSAIVAFVNLFFNVIFIVFLKGNASSIIIASSIGNFIAVFYLFKKIDIIHLVSLRYLDKKQVTKMLNYSIPMVPNILSWWILNVSDRTILTFFWGASANGIYTISCKFANIINSIFSIFVMSWQENASLHIKKENRDIIFSENINDTLVLFYSLIVISISFLPHVFNIVIGSNYKEAYIYIPILLVSCIFSILVTLLGGIYVAKKLTIEVAKTSILSALINIVINLLLINKLGIYAACLSTLISYMAMFIYRIIDVKKYVRITFDYRKNFWLTILLVISLLLYFNKLCYFNYLMEFTSVVCFFILNKKLLSDIVILFFNRIKR